MKLLIRFHTSTGIDKWFHPTHYCTCDYLSILWIKLNHISKRGFSTSQDLRFAMSRCRWVPVLPLFFTVTWTSLWQSYSFPNRKKIIWRRWVRTARCRYKAVNFLLNPHNRHPIARPRGRDMGCLLWVPNWVMIYLSNSSIANNIMLYWNAL